MLMMGDDTYATSRDGRFTRRVSRRRRRYITFASFCRFAEVLAEISPIIFTWPDATPRWRATIAAAQDAVAGPFRCPA